MSSDWSGISSPESLLLPMTMAAVRCALMPSRQVASSASFSCTACCFSSPVWRAFQKRSADHQIGGLQGALDEGEGRIAVQGGANERRRTCVAIEQDVLPGDEDIVQNHERVDLVEAVGQRIIGRVAAAGETGAADVLDAWRIHFDDAADGIF